MLSFCCSLFGVTPQQIIQSTYFFFLFWHMLDALPDANLSIYPGLGWFPEQGRAGSSHWTIRAYHKNIIYSIIVYLVTTLSETRYAFS